MLTTTPIMALVLALAAAAGLAPEEHAAAPDKSQTYQQLFYPEGMPREENPFSGEIENTVFELYGDVRLAEAGMAAVAFAEHLPVAGRDAVFKLMLGVVSEGTEPQRVLGIADLTDSIPVYTEFPGNVYRLRARLNAFEISPGAPALHLNAWAVLAGSGSTSGASDLFFRITEKGELEPVLELTGTSRRSRLGVGGDTAEDSSLHLVDLDRDGTAEIVAQKHRVGPDGDEAAVTSERPLVFRLAQGTYQRFEVDEATVKEVILEPDAGALELERCAEIFTVRPRS